MEEKIFKVDITTPNKKWTFDKVISCTAPGVKGSFQILFNHAPLMNQLEIGAIKMSTTEGLSWFATSGGFLEVLKNEVALLLESCEKAEEIDVVRAENAVQRAKDRLKLNENIDVARAEGALARAMNRIKVSRKI